MTPVYFALHPLHWTDRVLVVAYPALFLRRGGVVGVWVW